MIRLVMPRAHRSTGAQRTRAWPSRPSLAGGMTAVAACSSTASWPSASTTSATGSRRSASAPGLSADEIASRLGISRTALYRFEKGELAKIETLEKLAELLGVSVPTLLGVGVEYIASAVAYFERMRQIEETSEHIIVLAGPISYLLASDAFDRTLDEMLRESIPDEARRPQARARRRSTR